MNRARGRNHIFARFRTDVNPPTRRGILTTMGDPWPKSHFVFVSWVARGSLGEFLA
jgi:hypothetical protein